MPATAHVLNDRAVDLSHLFLKQKEDVHSTVLDGESVLLNLSTGRYYTLNIVGSIVWDLSTGDRSLAQVVSTIREKFDVTAQQAQDDLLDLVGELGQEGLIYTERR
ncbi:MAG: PqqD family protein [Nitrospira sp.]